MSEGTQIDSFFPFPPTDPHLYLTVRSVWPLRSVSNGWTISSPSEREEEESENSKNEMLMREGDKNLQEEEIDPLSIHPSPFLWSTWIHSTLHWASQEEEEATEIVVTLICQREGGEITRADLSSQEDRKVPLLLLSSLASNYLWSSVSLNDRLEEEWPIKMNVRSLRC